MYGNISDYQKKGTPGITALLCDRDDINHTVYDLDVGFTYPRSAGISNGSTVRRLKSDMS